jgi:hypothetical protein
MKSDKKGESTVEFSVTIYGKARCKSIYGFTTKFQEARIKKEVDAMPLWHPAMHRGRYVFSHKLQLFRY